VCEGPLCEGVLVWIAVAWQVPSATSRQFMSPANALFQRTSPRPSEPEPVRVASAGDIERLLQLEECCFSGDRLSRRSFRRLLATDTSATLVSEHGYLMLLFRRSSKVARIYSVAVDPSVRGRGLGRTLVEHAEAVSRARHRDAMQLEVRVDNLAAIRLYESLGYRPISRFENYYEDGCAALRYRKSLVTSGVDP
jgi:ribosomal protein S18 acetylase RimI-like enzyme